MFTLIIWAIFGLIVGLIAKAIHPGEDPVGIFPTIGIGVAGSYIGGGINWLLDMGASPFEPSGFLMGIIGGVIACAAWRWWSLKNSPQGPRSFFSGKKLR
jgi:uncharacterized membrane protein YeaQ/YmgE (transglycosylase-associated protein family)